MQRREYQISQKKRDRKTQDSFSGNEAFIFFQVRFITIDTRTFPSFSKPDLKLTQWKKNKRIESPVEILDWLVFLEPYGFVLLVLFDMLMILLVCDYCWKFEMLKSWFLLQTMRTGIWKYNVIFIYWLYLLRILKQNNVKTVCVTWISFWISWDIDSNGMSFVSWY